MAFMETFSLYLLKKLPWDEDDAEQEEIRSVFEELWGLLRDATLYFMRFEEGQHPPSRILQGQKLLLRYGKRVQEVSPLFSSGADLAVAS